MANLKFLYHCLADLMGSVSFDFKRHLADLIFAKGACTKTLCVPCGAVIPCDFPWRQAIIQVIWFSLFIH